MASLTMMVRASARAVRHSAPASLQSSWAAASSSSSACCVAASASSSSQRMQLHTAAVLRAPEPKAASKKKKEVVAAGPMVVPNSMSAYEFSHMNVLKEYKEPSDKVSLKPDAAYPAWIWDQTPEPTWGDLLLADFAALPPTYQKKVFSIPRKQEIKRKNDITKKG